MNGVLAFTIYMLISAAVIFVYMLPVFIAGHRHVHNRASIAVVNIFLGWTLVGWVIALAMAVSDTGRAPQVTR